METPNLKHPPAKENKEQSTATHLVQGTVGRGQAARQQFALSMQQHVLQAVSAA